MGSPRRKAGLLEPQVEGYRSWLTERGYTPLTVRNMLKDLGQVGLWATATGLQVTELDEGSMVGFLADCHAAGRRRVVGPRGLRPLVTYLRDVGVVPAAAPSSTPLAAGTGDRWWGLRAGGTDRCGRQRVPAPGVRAGFGRVGQGPGR